MGDCFVDENGKMVWDIIDIVVCYNQEEFR